MAKTEQWISVPGWRTFQHYDPAKRTPPWVKNYTDLLHDDAYLELGAGARAVLHGVWLVYASSHCQTRAEPSSLTRRLNLRVRKGHIDALVNAGFIEIVASKTLAEGYRSRARVETETETEQLPTPTVPSLTTSAARNGTAEHHDLEHIGSMFEAAPFDNTKENT